MGRQQLGKHTGAKQGYTLETFTEQDTATKSLPTQLKDELAGTTCCTPSSRAQAEN